MNPSVQVWGLKVGDRGRVGSSDWRVAVDRLSNAAGATRYRATLTLWVGNQTLTWSSLRSSEALAVSTACAMAQGDLCSPVTIASLRLVGRYL
jgi:hypothetical protein